MVLLPSRIRAGIALAAVVVLASRCGARLVVPCPTRVVDSGDSCGCVLVLPVDPAALRPSSGMTIWPFGVHGTYGHPEGHPGVDFISAVSIEVRAAADGVVRKIENGFANEHVSGAKSVYVAADCGVTYDYQPLILADGITVGSRLRQGQHVGVMAEMVAPYGPGRFTFHFDTRSDPTGSKYSSFCPGPLWSERDSTTLQSLIDASTFEEKSARTVSLTCRDGTEKTFSYPAEGRLCNAHLDEATASVLDGCLQLGSQRPVW